jgi:hypothetical protein
MSSLLDLIKSAQESGVLKNLAKDSAEAFEHNKTLANSIDDSVAGNLSNKSAGEAAQVLKDVSPKVESAVRSEIPGSLANPSLSSKIDDRIAGKFGTQPASESAKVFDANPEPNFVLKDGATPNALVPFSSAGKELTPGQNFTMRDAVGTNYPIPYAPKSTSLVPSGIEDALKDVSSSRVEKSPILSALKSYAAPAAAVAGLGGIAGLGLLARKDDNGNNSSAPAGDNVQIPYKPGFPLKDQPAADDQDNSSPTPPVAKSKMNAKAPVKADTEESHDEAETPVPSPDSPATSPLAPVSTYAALQQALNQRNMNQADSMIGKGLASAGMAIATGKGLGNDTFYDQNMKDADQPIKDLDMKMAMQTKDPASEQSVSLRNYIETSYGVKLNPNISMDDLKTSGMFKDVANNFEKQEDRESREQMRADTLAQQDKDNQLRHQDLSLRRQERDDSKTSKEDAKIEAADTKRFSHVNDKLSSALASSRSPFGSAAKNWRFADNIQALADQYKGNLNDMDSRQVEEMARSLDGLLSSGVSTVAGTANLVPHTLFGKVQSASEYVQNLPKGAQQGKFLQRMLDTVEREKQQASKQMQMYQGEILGDSTDLASKYPQKFEDMMTMKGLPTDFMQQTLHKNKNKNQVLNGPQSTQDPQVLKFAKDSNITYDHALTILKSRGYGK